MVDITDIEPIEEIVKNYFDNAIIIDDQLELNSREENIIVTDDEIGDLPDEVIGGFEEIALTTEYWQPSDVLKHFVSEGFVTYPYKFRYSDYNNQVSFLSNILSSAKLMIIDWDLEGSNPDSDTQRGQAAINLINEFIKLKKGIKCAVIYTQQDCGDVMNEIRDEFDFINSDYMFFQEKSSEESKTLFGFIMSKSITPQDVIKNIVNILYLDKSITLHFMECVNNLNNNLGKVLNKFNTPFEKALYSQIITSQIPDNEVPNFINHILFNSIIGSDIPVRDNVLFLTKKKRLVSALHDIESFKTSICSLCDLINTKYSKKIKIKCSDNKFLKDIKTIIMAKKVNSFTSFKHRIEVSVKKYNEFSGNDQQHITNTLAIIIILIDNFISDDNSFKDDFISQMYIFTKLMKYNEKQIGNIAINTGDIYNVRGNGEYALCISPFCDTFRPKKIDNIYKFVVGKVIDENDSKFDDYLKDSNESYTILAVPDDENKKLIFIKFNFYNTVSYSKRSVARLKRVASLKDEYIQSIINKYVGYQSRAGIEKVFFKESDYISCFKEILR